MIHDPDKPLFGVTPLQVRVLLNADDQWRTVSDLNGGRSFGNNGYLIDALVRAGFLTARKEGQREKYRISPAGREFATYLKRLEAVRDSS